MSAGKPRYKIFYYRVLGVGTQSWPGGFADARGLAIHAVERGLARKAKVRDDAGRLVLEYPKQPPQERGAHMPRLPSRRSASMDHLLDARERLHLQISVAADAAKPDPDGIEALIRRLADIELEIATERPADEPLNPSKGS